MAERRSLTEDEACIVQRIFRSSVPPARIQVVRRRHLYGGYTPYGDINVGPGSYSDNYVPALLAGARDEDAVNDAHFFIHEMAHVWQHHIGMALALEWMRARAEGRRVLRASGKGRYAFNRDAGTYAYQITPGKPDLLDYNMEQQCDIVADYFASLFWGRRLDANPYNIFGYTPPTRGQLCAVLGNFLTDPRYPMRDRALWRRRAAFRN